MVSLGLVGSLFFSESLSLSLYPAQHDYASSLEAFFPSDGSWVGFSFPFTVLPFPFFRSEASVIETTRSTDE